MTPRPAGDSEQGVARTPGHARAPESAHVPPPGLPADQDRDASPAPAAGELMCQSHDRGPTGHNGTRTEQDGSSAPRQPLPPRLQLWRDILSNKENMLTGLILLILVVAFAMAVPAGLVYILLAHVSGVAKVCVGSGASVAITVGGKLMYSRRGQKRRERLGRGTPEKPADGGSTQSGGGGTGS